MFKLMGYSDNDVIPNETCLELLTVLFSTIKSGEAAKYFMNRIYGIF